MDKFIGIKKGTNLNDVRDKFKFLELLSDKEIQILIDYGWEYEVYSNKEPKFTENCTYIPVKYVDTLYVFSYDTISFICRGR